MDVEVGPRVAVARITAVSADRHVLYLEFRNSTTGTVSGSEPFDLEVGSVLLVDAEADHVELAPDQVWPEESWVGVVRLRLDDVTVIEASGGLQKVKTNDGEYGLGNTVEASDSAGVIRVLHDEPIRFLDSSRSDESVLAQFKTDPEANGEGFEDFGGLKDVVKRARELIELPLERHDELAAIKARPIKGVLFTGPPGTGKTMLARIIANKANAEFYEIGGPAIFSKWYGESEKILRTIFEDASRQKRSIVFFDEIDSIATQRNDEAHEASRRVVAQLLTLMDGFSPDSNVVVIATTNRPQDIDIALRRPGRLDWEIDFRLPTREDREEILQIAAKKLSTSPPLPHALVAEKTNSWSAAELTAIWSEAALLAVDDGREVILSEDYLGGYMRVADRRQRSMLEALQVSAQ